MLESDSDSEAPPDLVELTDTVSPLPVAFAAPSPPLPPVPVTILTGFLGSGKTTLVRKILNSPDHGLRIAVIENEYGEGSLGDGGGGVNMGGDPGSIESALVIDGGSGGGSDDDGGGKRPAAILELPNGCLCCTVRDSFVDAVEMLLARRTDFDHVLVETSGLADPGPAASVFWSDDPGKDGRCRLDGIVAVVDCANFLSLYDDGRPRFVELARQIAYADRIVLNKVDLLSSPPRSGADADADTGAVVPDDAEARRLARVTQAVRQINSSAPAIAAVRCRIPDLAGWILGINSLGRTTDGAAGVVPHGGGEEPGSECVECGTGDAARWRGPKLRGSKLHGHTTAVSTVTLYGRGSVSLPAVNAWLADVLWPDQDVDNAEANRAIGIGDDNGDGDGDGAASAFHAKDRGKQEGMEIYRIKGLVSIAGGEEGVDGKEVIDPLSRCLDSRKHIVQAVNDVWEVYPTSSNSLLWGEAEPRSCKLVVIGKWLVRNELKAGFSSCFVD